MQDFYNKEEMMYILKNVFNQFQFDFTFSQLEDTKTQKEIYEFATVKSRKIYPWLTM